MEINTIFGLPAHPLLVHIPVALIPLCAIGAIVMVVSTTWRARIGWVVVGLMGFTVVASQLAIGSGETLEEAINKESAALDQHTEMGESFLWFALVFFLAVLGFMIWDTVQRRKASASGAADDSRARSRTPVAILLSILVVVTAVGATARVYQVGHSGAKAVWAANATALQTPGGG
jgi:uncharacterized membrane protein